MALRKIRIDGDEVLRKKCRKVEVFDDKLRILLDDMVETMYYAEGVGLAAPQIGILKRAVVIDVGEGVYKMINPEITERFGEQIHSEACLSVPGYEGDVARPERLIAKYFDENGKEKTIEATGLFAVAICHELDHLDGVLFKDKASNYHIREDE